jgi:hypothetical protein
MQNLSDEGRKLVEDVAQRHGVSTDAVVTLLMALVAGQGSQAQFSHPDLGGMGQWSQGGMIMVGDMFNQGLKARVDALCTELSGLLRRDTMFAAAPRPSQSQSQSQSGGGADFGSPGVSLFVAGSGAAGDWWPDGLGAPGSVGAQNDLAYATFPAARRLAIRRGGQVSVYDTADHRISGFSQQQGGDQSLTFTSQHGLVRVADLAVVPPGAAEATPAAAPPHAETAPAPVIAPAQPAPVAEDDIFAKIKLLADLRKKNILTEQEFEAKKAELLARL